MGNELKVSSFFSLRVSIVMSLRFHAVIRFCVQLHLVLAFVSEIT